MKPAFIISTALFILLTLSGCASSHWEKAGVASNEAQADELGCQYEADKATASTTLSDPVGSGVMSAFIKQTCMKTKGYYLVRDN